MYESLVTSRTQTLNSKIGAITLGVGALMTLLLSHTTLSLAPLRIFTLAVAAFAVWSFSDEMGIRKPLNRAGFICFVIAAIAKVQVSLGIDPHLVGRYFLLYASFLLLAMLFWSVAFLHRKPELKVVGVVGVLATAVPIAAIVIGHIVVGVGLSFGISSLLEATQGATLSDTSFITMVERIFGLWCFIAAWLLWRGHITSHNAVSDQA